MHNISIVTIKTADNNNEFEFPPPANKQKIETEDFLR